MESHESQLSNGINHVGYMYKKEELCKGRFQLEVCNISPKGRKNGKGCPKLSHPRLNSIGTGSDSTVERLDVVGTTPSRYFDQLCTVEVLADVLYNTEIPFEKTSF